MTYKSFFYLVILLILNGCSNKSSTEKLSTDTMVTLQEQKVDSNIIRVYVEQDGRIIADEKEISITNLDSSFSKIKQSNGIVYYSRANGQGEPPQESMMVMELIVKYSLPVKLFTDKTFTEIVSM